ncbi:hypothetical protein [Caballeronia ptereochthonis]|uniref:Uncharacterized protein n=1 Tax=Caballeronia ptereochthonis TaxID=1777144 RepID=A0A158ABR0_9BURK|nr:hypothetical protein [Caballeronia ptereochthonis]SAK55281.1 hypothetical protein AWB83_01626 [Caballeronia ptereochthonis]
MSRRAVNRRRRQLKRHVRRYRPAGKADIVQNQEGYRYLKWRGAKGRTLSMDLIFLGPRRSRSTLCEELLHAIQFRRYLHDDAVDRYGTPGASTIMELLAARTLVTREMRWKIV